MASDPGVHGFCGADCGSQTVIEYQGATVSSNVWVTSRPGWATVGRALGSSGRRSRNVTLSPEPGWFETKRMDGSSCPMYFPFS